MVARHCRRAETRSSMSALISCRSPSCPGCCPPTVAARSTVLAARAAPGSPRTEQLPRHSPRRWRLPRRDADQLRGWARRDRRPDGRPAPCSCAGGSCPAGRARRVDRATRSRPSVSATGTIQRRTRGGRRAGGAAHAGAKADGVGGRCADPAVSNRMFRALAARSVVCASSPDSSRRTSPPTCGRAPTGRAAVGVLPGRSGVRVPREARVPRTHSPTSTSALRASVPTGAAPQLGGPLDDLARG